MADLRTKLIGALRPGAPDVPWNRDRSAVAAAVGVHGLWFVALVIHLFSRRWVPTSDYAVIEAKIRDVATAHNPLTGAFSRFGYDHPGPAMFYVLAVPYRLLGSNPRGVLVGVAVIGFVSCVLATLITLRRSPLLGAIATLGGLALVLSLARDNGLVNPWNPWVGVLPFFAFLVAAWALSSGSWWCGVAAVVLGTWCVQAHLGFAPLVALVGITAVVLGWRFDRTRDADPARERRRNRTIVIGAVVGLVLWLPPLIDQFTGTGNLGRILSASGTATQGFVGLGRAIESTAYGLSPLGPWSIGESGVAGFGSELRPGAPILLLLPIGCGILMIVAGRKRGQWDLVCWGALSLVAIVAAVISISRIDGPPLDYLALWLRPLAAFVYAGTAWLGVAWVAERWPADLRTRLRSAAAVAGVAVVLLALLVPLSVKNTAPPNERESLALRRAYANLVVALDDKPGPYVVQPYGDAFLTIGSGLTMELERDGRKAYEVDGNAIFGASYDRPVLGAQRVRSADQGTLLRVASGRKDVDARLAAGDKPIAEGNVLTPDEVAEMNRLAFVLPPAAVFLVLATPDRLDHHGPMQGFADHTWEEANFYIDAKARDYPVMIF